MFKRKLIVLIIALLISCPLSMNSWCGSDVNDTSDDSKVEHHAPGMVTVSDPNTEPNNPDTNDVSPGDTFNKEFAEILSEYVNEQGMVDYAKLRRYRLKVKAMLAQLAILDSEEYESWTKNEKIAFWINAYNMLMLDIIVENYPIESKRLHRLWWHPTSIRHIPPRSTVGTPKWNNYKFIVMDEEFTLSEIEERFFKKEFKDPRIFLALTLASMDSPPLKNNPYFGKNLDEQLNEQMKRFLSNSAAFRIDKDKNVVYLSVLFEPKQPWYGIYFLDDYATDKKFKSHNKYTRAILNFISGYIDNRDVSYLETGNYSISHKGYDWRVNQQ
jgi:hypothetical protein